MSTFCTNCGATLEEGAKFCTSCGTVNEPAAPETEAPVQVAPETPAQPVEETPAQPVEETPAQPAAAAAAPKESPIAKLLSNKKLMIAAVAAVAVVVVAILLFSMMGGKGSGYTSAIDTYFDYWVGKASKSEIKSLLPDGFWTYKQEQENKTFDDCYAELAEALENRTEQMENRYGKNIKITYEITKEWTVSDWNQKLIADALQRLYNFEEDAVSDARKLEMEATIAGSEDDEDDNMTFYVIKIDGDWYLANVYFDNGEAGVRFVAS